MKISVLLQSSILLASASRLAGNWEVVASLAVSKRQMHKLSYLFDILIRNPHGGGKQIILDVAVTGLDGNTRTNDDKPDQPLKLAVIITYITL